MAPSEGRPPPNSGDAMGEYSTLKRSVPSLGLVRSQAPFHQSFIAMRVACLAFHALAGTLLRKPQLWQAGMYHLDMAVGRQATCLGKGLPELV